MKIAVVGASGYIGQHLIRSLATIPGVDIIAASRSPSPSAGANNVKPLAIDIAASVDPYEELGRPDKVIHLAWGGLPNYKSVHHFETELPNQFRFLHSLIRAGLKQLMVTGTCYEYGMRNGELREDIQPGQPTNTYALAKVSLHRQLRLLQSSDDFELTWARLFYSFGDGQSPSSLYALLKAAIARGDRSFPMSRGEQLRDFLPIGQIADHLARLAVLSPDVDVNVCSGQPISIRRLVETWIVENGWQIDLELGRFEYPDYEPLAFWGSNSLLKSLLDFPPVDR